MALNKNELMVFDSLVLTAKTLLQNGVPKENVLTAIEGQVAVFKTNTKADVLIDLTDMEKPLKLLDTSSDHLRIRTRSEDSQADIVAKMSGIPLRIGVFKKESFSFSNNEVINSLEQLIRVIKASNVEFCQLLTTDFVSIDGEHYFVKEDKVKTESASPDMPDEPNSPAKLLESIEQPIEQPIVQPQNIGIVE